jgi:hypothetical protein
VAVASGGWAALALGATNQVRTSVTVVMAEADVTTVAIGIDAAVKPVVFEVGTQLEAVFR